MKYLVMCKVYTDVGGIKYLYHVCPPVRKIIHSLKLVDYLHVQADNPWYNYNISHDLLLSLAALSIILTSCLTAIKNHAYYYETVFESNDKKSILVY